MLSLSMYSFFLYSSYAVIVFFLPLYFQANGLSTTVIGFLFAVGSLITIVAQPFWGYISDKNKTIKRVLLITLIGGGVSSIGLFLSQSVALLLLLMLLFNFFISAQPPLTDSISLAYAREHNKNFGLIRLWGSIGIGLAALTIGWLTDHIGISYLGIIYALLLTLAVSASFFLSDSKQESVPVTKESIKHLVGNRLFLWFLFLVLLVSIPHRMNDSLLGIFLMDMGATETQVGQAWLVATISSAPIFAVMGLLLKRYQEMTLFILSGLFYALRWDFSVLLQIPR